MLRWLVLATINLRAKFEVTVSVFTLSKDRRGRVAIFLNGSRDLPMPP